MTTLSARADAIHAQASTIDWRKSRATAVRFLVRSLVILVALLPFLLGWSVRMVCEFVSLVRASVVYGWRTAGEQSGRGS